jgi:hypothetical protein
MSTPENPLNRYRTYAYHHILLIADSVETAYGAITGKNLTQLVRNPNGEIRVFTAGNGGSYIVLINGMKDTNYLIRKLRFESIMNTGKGAVGKGTLVSETGNMEIEEPKGIKFFQDIATASSLLRMDGAGAIWAIKTIFVGYPFDPNLPPEVIPYVAPLTFTPTNITADYTELGGQYNVEFVSITNGAASMPRVNNVTDSLKLESGDGENTLPEVLNKLFSKINEKSEKYFDESAEQIDTNTYIPQKVVYKLVIDDHYVQNAQNYKVNGALQQNTTSGMDDAGPVFDFSKGVNITNAIAAIMKACPQVAKDGLDEEKQDVRYQYLVTSTVNSNTDDYEVIYVVKRYRILTSESADKISKGTDIDSAKFNNNILELDYIYTGKNIDIIDFSIRMEEGFSFFKTLVSGNSLLSQKQKLDSGSDVSEKPTTSTGVPSSERASAFGNKIKYPLFVKSTNKNAEIRNIKQADKQMEYQELIARQAQIEMIEAKIKIHGNPNLLNSVNIPPDDIANPADPAPNPNTKTFSYWQNIPALMKVNIKMPDDNSSMPNGFSTFWYDGLYKIHSITTEFDDSLFTQELDIMSFGASNNVAKDEQNKKNTNQETQKNKTGGGTQVQDESTGNVAVVQEATLPPEKIKVKDMLNNIKTKNINNL